MTKIIAGALVFFVLTGFSACETQDKPLTEKEVKAYISAQHQFSRYGEDIKGEKVVTIIREAGFRDEIEFMQVSLKIASVISAVRAEKLRQDIESIASPGPNAVIDAGKMGGNDEDSVKVVLSNYTELEKIYQTQ